MLKPQSIRPPILKFGQSVVRSVLGPGQSWMVCHGQGYLPGNFKLFKIAVVIQDRPGGFFNSGQSEMVCVATVLAPGSCHGGTWVRSLLAPCSSVEVPCWVRGDDVLRLNFTQDHPGSRYLLIRGVPCCSVLSPAYV